MAVGSIVLKWSFAHHLRCVYLKYCKTVAKYLSEIEGYVNIAGNWTWLFVDFSFDYFYLKVLDFN